MVDVNNVLSTVKELCKYGPRIGENEAKAREWLIKILKQNNQNVILHKYAAEIPTILKTDAEGGLIIDELKTIHSANIIIRDIRSADTLICAHYDSVWGGAVDNAAAVALLLELSKEKPNNVAIVLLGCEEAGSKPPVYWAHGSKMLAQDYDLAHINKIIVLEMLGSSVPEIASGKNISDWKYENSDCRNFPIEKCVLINGDMNVIMKDYHKETDMPDLLNSKNIIDSWNAICGLVAQPGRAHD